ncbi:MAG: methionyl-tRNA formyltransferase [Chlorobiota bacterium]
MRIVFMGTPHFAVPSLEALHREFGVELVITAPEKPQGRGLRLRPSPVKEAALRLGIPVWEPASLRDPEFVQQFRAVEPDFIVVIAFRIVPPEVYGCARRAAFCVHPSLLPKLRGAAPIHWAIIRGETVTGVTSFLLEPSVDTGPILLRREHPISDGTTYGELHDQLMPLAAELAVETLRGLLAGTLHPRPQDHLQATTAPKLRPEDCHLRWDRPAEEVRRWIHGLSPEPGAWALLEGQRIRMLRARTVADSFGPPGTFRMTEDRFLIACAEGSVEVLELQREGRRAVPAEAFLRGWRGGREGRLL